MKDMKRLLIFLGFLAMLSAQAQNTLSLSSTSGHPGDTVTLTLSLSNSSAVTAMQAFVPLHGQLTYVAGSATLSERSNGHAVSATVLRDTLRIYSYSMGLNAFTGNSGALLTFRLVLGNEPATYSMPLCSAMLSSSTGSSLPVQATAGSVTILAPKISLTYGTSQAGAPAYQIDYGHCPIRSNYTRNVTVRNIGNEPLSLVAVGFIDSTLSASPAPATIPAGSQQTVTVSYLPVTAGTVTLNGIFHSNAKVGDSLLTIYADPYAVNELRPLAVSGYTDSIVTVQLRMNNMDSIVGLQTSIKLPAALTYIPGSFAVESSRSQDHQASVGLLGDTLTMLVTSLTNSPLRDGDGVVASFQLRLHGYGSYTLSLLQTALSDTAGRNVLSAVYSGSVYIYSPTISCASSIAMGNTPVTDTVETAFTISNNGNAPLVIERIQFMSSRTSQYFSVAESMPLTIGNYQNATIHVRYAGTEAGHFGTMMQIYNNDPRATLRQVTVSGERYEPNDLYLGAEGDQVGVMLDNYSAVTALQMDVEYPHNFATLENGDIQATARSNGHFVSSARQNDSTWRILLLSMNNQPLVGNSGSVLNLHLHIIDSNDMGRYPVTLHNVMVANASGVNVLSSLDNTVYIATRLLWDTLYIHDTTVVVEIEQVHDTTTLIVHDTTIVTEFVHDTTYIDNYIHDTTIVDNYIHDTTYLWQYDTTIVTVQLHDTTYIDNYIHDTTTLVQYIHDTTIIDNYIHDTTYIANYIHDTTYVDNYIHDTSYLWQYDTTVVTEFVFDTTVVVLTDTLTLTEIDTLYLFDTIYMVDTLYLHDTIYIHDTVTVGVKDVTTYELKIYPNRGQIVVEGASGLNVSLFDINGRLLATKRENHDPVRFDVPISGAYLIKPESFPARKIVVIR